VLHARYGMGHRNDARAARGTAQGAGGATEVYESSCRQKHGLKQSLPFVEHSE